MKTIEEVRKQRHTSRRAGQGFTLVELMIVVAVIAILGAIAFPSYQEAVRKGHRGQAKADLLDLAQRAERFRTVNGTYAGFTLGPSDDQSPRQGTKRYTVTLATTATTFTLKAVPFDALQLKDARCRTLVLDQAGQKTIEGTPTPTGTAAECW